MDLSLVLLVSLMLHICNIALGWWQGAGKLVSVSERVRRGTLRCTELKLDRSMNVVEVERTIRQYSAPNPAYAAATALQFVEEAAAIVETSQLIPLDSCSPTTLCKYFSLVFTALEWMYYREEYVSEDVMAYNYYHLPDNDGAQLPDDERRARKMVDEFRMSTYVKGHRSKQLLHPSTLWLALKGSEADRIELCDISDAGRCWVFGQLALSATELGAFTKLVLQLLRIVRVYRQAAKGRHRNHLIEISRRLRAVNENLQDDYYFRSFAHMTEDELDVFLWKKKW